MKNNWFIKEMKKLHTFNCRIGATYAIPEWLNEERKKAVKYCRVKAAEITGPFEPRLAMKKKINS